METNKETDADISSVIKWLFITAHKVILKLARTHVNNLLYYTRLSVQTVEGVVVLMLQPLYCILGASSWSVAMQTSRL